MPERKTVMISSTARDLPEHRKEVMDACLRQGMFPVMIEQMSCERQRGNIAARRSRWWTRRIFTSASLRIATAICRKQGNPAQIPVTEIEYNHTVERKIPHTSSL